MSGVNLNTIDGGFITTASFTASTSTTTSVVAAVTGQKVRVYKAVITAAAGQTVQFLDGSTVISPAFFVGTAAPLVLSMDGNPWYTTSAGNALQAAVTSAVATAIEVWFSQNANI